ncbi:hypothetical protein CMV_000303 [Castanea mollissima]|uniref:Phytocyanin domain-containing protein n=1 Tax=Castanea mollissima TaxID=60419 RepID=A0A8J4W555_9ROSI|nr:hypothetical protein CMV_000303 [Castanea mollissima]
MESEALNPFLSSLFAKLRTKQPLSQSQSDLSQSPQRNKTTSLNLSRTSLNLPNEFVFNPTNYNVVVVDKHAYETCKAAEGTFEYNSGDDTVPLNKGENYFICTKRGCCESNMKMMIVAAAGQRQTEREETGQVRSGQDNKVKSWVRLIGICYMFLFLLII